MEQKQTRIEKELYITINIWNYLGFTDTILQELNISERSLYRYIKEINDSRIFIAPIIAQKKRKGTYRLQRTDWDGKPIDFSDFAYETNTNPCMLFQTQIEIQKTDTANAVHLKRLAFICAQYHYPLIALYNPEAPNYQLHFFDAADQEAVIATLKTAAIAKKIAACYPEFQVTNRTVQRDLKLIQNAFLQLIDWF